MKSRSLESPKATFQVSGQLVIIGILGVALAAAAASWDFRYIATHRAAEFWGPDVARLIRDAPLVTLFKEPGAESAATTSEASAQGRIKKIDISNAPGLTHLRNALLEDQSFDWSVHTLSPMLDEEDPLYHLSLPWTLSFVEPATKEATIRFSKDCRVASKTIEMKRISTDPIAAGLREMFDEFVANSTMHSDKSSR